MKDQQYVKTDVGAGKRLMGLSIAAAVMLFLLVTRLWYLQIIESDSLMDLSESNRLRFVPVTASRGAILDRNGKVLVSNSPSFSLAVIPQDVKDKESGLLAVYISTTVIDGSESRMDGPDGLPTAVAVSPNSRRRMERASRKRGSAAA